MLPCKKRKTIRMDSFSEAETVPTEASPSDGPLLPKPEIKQEEEGEVSPTMKSMGDTQRVEPLREVKEEPDETRLFISVDKREGGKKSRRKGVKRQWEGKSAEEDEGGGRGEGGKGGRALACDLKLDETLDRTLEDGAKQHNLTAVNVRNILHEVITNEHVVAMMKAAISETEDAPVFEPKMTRSKLKEVVEKGVVIPTWNISPIKKANELKPPQFVDIPLEDDDSSDEEYQPEEDEEDETAEESLLESDVESNTSSPRGAKRFRSRPSDTVETDEEGVAPLEAEKGSSPPAQRHVSAEVIPMGPPPPPKPKQNKDTVFMEKLHAVDEELASSPICMDSYQPLEDSLIAFRTRSKRPLKDVPLGQLEAELRAPDITPDMYDPNTADDEEWKQWLGGLMNDDVENEDEADDDDDPEYNFLEDLDEPDTEDFRNDRAVRITKKEVNELMEELFETFQDEIGFPNVEDDGQEDEEGTAEARPNFNTPQVLRFEEPLANLLNEQHRTVKEQLEQLRVKKSAVKLPQEMERSKLRNEKAAQTLALDAGQRKRLQQQMQQHVQLLTQVHLLASCNPSLNSEASTARLFLNELESFAKSSLLLSQPSSPGFQTSFQPFNLKESLQLIKDFHAHVKIEWSPRKAVKKNMTDFACLPKQVAWILATRRVFLYPELLPTCSFKAKTPRDKIVFTKGEDNLLALGLKHFEGTDFPKPLISKYLLTTKTAHQLTGRIKNRNMNRVPDNIIRYYRTTKQLPVLPRLCEEIQPGDWKPPVEQEEHLLPFWLKASMPSIQEAIEQQQQRARADSQGPDADPKAGSDSTHPTNPECPLRMPEGLQLILRPLSSRFCRRIWRWQRPAVAKPFLVQPSLCLPPAGTGGFIKMSAKQPLPATTPGKLATHVSPLSQPASLVQPLSAVPHLNLPSALGHGAPFELQGVLSAQPSGPRPCLAPAVPSNVVSSLPVAFHPKMILPALPSNRVRKAPVPRGYQKKKPPKVAPLLKAAPVLHSTPVIFTVPAGTVKVLGIANGCNVLQPLSAATRAVSAPQPIPITTLLVNSTPFSCPLNQSLAASPTLPLVVASNSGPTPTSALVKDMEMSTQPVNKVASVGDAPDPGKANPKTGPEEAPGDVVGSWSSNLHPEVQAEPPVQGYVEVGEGRPPEVVAPAPFSPMAELGDLVKVDLEATKETSSSEAAPVPQNPSSEDSPMKEELILGLGQGLEVEPASAVKKELEEVQNQPGGEEEEEEEEETANSTGPQASSTEGSHASPTNVGGSSVADNTSSSLGKVEASASQEGGGEKDGLEEEEEEDFDDYIQDEEDEMSSASEESVLSVPELQETMEKLTWLASERRLSQEGDSEEENSQEENSEPEEEEEEEEEGEGEPLESQQKEDEMADEVVGPGDGPTSSLASACAAPTVVASRSPPGENPKTATKSRASHRARAKRGRGRTSKDASKLLLLYDDDILERDPLREQKDFAFAQAYLNRVREALRLVPGKYEEFLRNIYEFENNLQKQTAVDLYARLRVILQDWPQLLTDFAAFLLPEQALECGLFEEQQAFEKSRTFLRRLEICFAENPSHHQKIIKVLQNCADCVPQEIMELKTQMWQLLKGHDHLQDEFSVFFDHLRPSASRLGDFEEINWTEEKEYEFDGFEEVSLPDMEEEEEPPKIHAASKNKRRKELGSQNAEKESEWPEGQKDWCSSCHENSGDPRLKRSKRRTCANCSSKVGDPKGSKNKEPGEFVEGRSQREPSPRPEGKETSEGNTERRDDGEAVPGRIRAASRKGDSAGGGGARLEGKPLSSREPPPEGLLPSAGKSAEPPLAPPCPPNAAEPTKNTPMAPLPPSRGAFPPKPHRLKSSLCPTEGKREVGHGPRSGGEAPSAPNPNNSETEGPSKAVRPDPNSPPSLIGAFVPSRPSLKEPGGRSPTGTTKPKAREMLSKDLPLKTLGASLQTEPEMSPTGGTQALNRTGKTAEGGGDVRSPKEDGSAPATVGPDRGAPVTGEDLQPRTIEPTVCAKNIKVSSTGEKVVLWTREADRVILTSCQERGADPQTFSTISEQLGNKTPEEVAHRFRELMTLFHTACDVSSDDEDDGMSTSHTDQLSDKDPTLSEDEREEPGF